MSDVQPGDTSPPSLRELRRAEPPLIPEPAHPRPLSMVEATKRCLRKFDLFSGRARRAEYWKFLLAVLLVQVVTIAVHGLIFGPDIQTDPATGYSKAVYSGGWFLSIFNLLALTPLVSAGWRRIHDLDLSGWWLLAPFGLTAFFLVASFAYVIISNLGFAGALDVLRGNGAFHFRSQGGRLETIIVLAVLGSYLLLIIQLARAGTQGPNRFGPDPLEVTP